MDDLINRQAAIEAIFSEPLYESGMKKRDADAVVPAIYEKIKSLPSAQPRRKKGKWIYYPKASGSVTSTAVHLYPVCSECGCEHPIVNYCPNCGTRMEEGEE